MRYGAMNFPIRPVLEEIDVFGPMKMDYLELAMDSPMAHHSLLAKQNSAIRRSLDKWGMTLICHLPTFVYLAHLTDAIRRASLQETIEALETAAILGAEKVVVHPGYIQGMAVHVIDHAMTLVYEALEHICSKASALRMPLCIENMFPGLGPFVEPDDFEPFFKTFPEMKLVLDTGHANINDPSGRRIMDFIRRFGDRLGHVHISDNNGRSDEHLPVGRGNIRFEALARELCRQEYDDTLTLEIFTEDRSLLTQSRTRLAKMLKA